MMAPLLTRRSALLGLTAAVERSAAPRWRWPRPRPSGGFVVVMLRGALDGMAAVVPYGDPDLAACGASCCRPRRGGRAACSISAGSTACTRRWPGCTGCIAAGELLPVHAVGRPDPQPQPFRGAGLHGERRRPPHDQRLAEPGGAGPDAGGGQAADRALSVGARCRCCCAGRRRSAARRRSTSPHPDAGSLRPRSRRSTRTTR